MFDAREFAEMKRELAMMDIEKVSGQAHSERYKKSVARMMQDNEENLGQFQPVRYKIRKSFWSKIMDWFDRLTSIV